MKHRSVGFRGALWRSWPSVSTMLCSGTWNEDGLVLQMLVMSSAILGLAAFETAWISVPTIVDALRQRTDYSRCTRRLDRWARRLVRQAGINVETVGRHHIDPSKSYVVMSNHQSLYDIPVVFQALQVPVRMIAKKELFRIPVMGRAMRDSGFVEIDRENRRRAVQSLKLAKQRMVSDGLSIWIAPEGTRSSDGVLGPFKTGGFYLAIDAGVPILPLTLDGTIDTHQAGSKRVNLGRTTRVVVHEPVDTSQFGRKQLRQLMQRLRETIASGLPESQRGEG